MLVLNRYEFNNKKIILTHTMKDWHAIARWADYVDWGALFVGHHRHGTMSLNQTNWRLTYSSQLSIPTPHSRLVWNTSLFFWCGLIKENITTVNVSKWIILLTILNAVICLCNKWYNLEVMFHYMHNHTHVIRFAIIVCGMNSKCSF